MVMKEIPYEVVADICAVYEAGRKEDVEEFPNDRIGGPDGGVYTTWSTVFKIREKIKSAMNEKKATCPICGYKTGIYHCNNCGTDGEFL